MKVSKSSLKLSLIVLIVYAIILTGRNFFNYLSSFDLMQIYLAYIDRILLTITEIYLLYFLNVFLKQEAKFSKAAIVIYGLLIAYFCILCINLLEIFYEEYNIPEISTIAIYVFIAVLQITLTIILYNFPSNNKYKFYISLFAHSKLLVFVISIGAPLLLAMTNIYGNFRFINNLIPVLPCIALSLLYIFAIKNLDQEHLNEEGKEVLDYNY
ncbi:MAG: hypothetical protein ACK40G_05275 [Cytophagaceae bacterium]